MPPWFVQFACQNFACFLAGCGRQSFEYFDCCQAGLTATPVDFVARNTFKIFQCDEQDPTANDASEEAIGHEQVEVDKIAYNKNTKPPLALCQRN